MLSKPQYFTWNKRGNNTMIVKNNLLAMNSHRILGLAGVQKGKVAEKLSSGYKINRSADDAAGLSISEKMRRQIRGLRQASFNAQDGISLCQTAEGALHEVHDMLQRLNELSVKAANETNSSEDASYLQQEVRQLQKEVDRIADTTTFNDKILLNGNFERKSSTAGIVAPKVHAQSGTRIVVMEAITTTQQPSGTTSAGNTDLKNLLATELVPNAVQAILNTFSDTFSYLTGSEIGIGLNIYQNYDTSVLASVSAGASMGKMGYMLSVNTAYYMNTEEGRTELERTVAHEMMHALMSEALTAGMTNQNKDGNYAEGFPSWFIEGTAQLISGAFEPYNNWIDKLYVKEHHDESIIEYYLSQAKLGSGIPASEYGTGYLAVMYLGHIIGRNSDIDPDSIADGVDTLLNYMRGGASLNAAIQDLTSYAGIDDFTNNFSKDGAGFTKNLLGIVNANSGTGSILKGKFETEDILENGDHCDDVNSGLFKLNTSATMVSNDYSSNPDHTMIEGGLLYDFGEAGQDHPNAPGSGSGSQPDTPDPDNPDPDAPGGGGTIVDPDAPGGGGTTTDPDAPGGNTGSGASVRGGIHLQIGADGFDHNQMTIFLPSVNTATLGIDQVNIGTHTGAANAIEQIKKAIQLVSMHRCQIGAYQNRLEHTVRNLDNVVENTMAAESRIRDTDMAESMVNFSKSNILEQVAQSMLAQGQQHNNKVLLLLQ